MDNFIDLFNKFIGKMQTDVLFAVMTCVCFVFFLVYYFLLFKVLVNNRAGKLIMVLSVILVLFAAVASLCLPYLRSVFILFPIATGVVTVSLFAVEIKRILWSKKTIKSEVKKGETSVVDESRIKKNIAEIIKALQDMSKNNVGAIIILSNGNIPKQIKDSGVTVDSDISSELIESIFFPKTPLHDGAMIIEGSKIVAAGCFLPLSQNMDSLPKDLGTRHRAGIGITENIDVISLIVSEETGIISVASAGKITRYADINKLKDVLGNYYW